MDVQGSHSPCDLEGTILDIFLIHGKVWQYPETKKKGINKGIKESIIACTIKLNSILFEFSKRIKNDFLSKHLIKGYGLIDLNVHLFP